MMLHWWIVAFAVAFAPAVGCNTSRRSLAPIPDAGATPTTTPVPSGTCGDSNAPLREAREKAREKLRRVLELTKTVNADDAREGRKTIWAAKARRLNAINVEDGIDEEEADTIAEMYFEMHLGDCGGPQRPTKVGRSWTSIVNFGLLGEPLSTPIKIDARTGGVQGPDGPRYASLAAFRRAWSARK